jgi:hypothetical protein
VKDPYQAHENREKKNGISEGRPLTGIDAKLLDTDGTATCGKGKENNPKNWDSNGGRDHSEGAMFDRKLLLEIDPHFCQW